MYILFKTGLRISEFCGLTLSDIDFKNHRINVDHQMQKKGKRGYYIEETKGCKWESKNQWGGDTRCLPFPRYKQEPIRVQHFRRTMGVLGYKKVVYRNQYLWRG